MEINFVPEIDSEVVNKAVSSYRDIWGKEGQRIVGVIESVSGLKFKQENLSVTVIGQRGRSSSHPFRLRNIQDEDSKRSDLVHELGHILIVDNDVKHKYENDEEKAFVIHKCLDLILYDIWTDLYGEEMAKKYVEQENSHEFYIKAWEWALAMNKEERQKYFARVRESKRFPI